MNESLQTSSTKATKTQKASVRIGNDMAEMRTLDLPIRVRILPVKILLRTADTHVKWDKAVLTGTDGRISI